jgi:hypothetical protein
MLDLQYEYQKLEESEGNCEITPEPKPCRMMA